VTEYHDTSAIFERLMVLNHEAFDAASYTSAYHALATALHAAYIDQDAEGFATVERLAGEQLAVIDATAQEYEHSTQAAQTRGRRSIFMMLARQAHVMLLMLADDLA
jgi:hypothetical protein